MRNRSTIIIGATVTMALLLVGLWSWISRPEGGVGPPLALVEDPLEFSSHVSLGAIGLLTSENYIGHRIRIVEGSLENVGREALRSVRLRLRFTDAGGQTVLEFEGEALPAAQLAPGQVHRYVFRFENLPPEWNYRVPEITVVQLGL
jgi:hypothetical protein